MKGTLFAPNFAPSMQNQNSLTPSSAYMYLVVFYVGKNVCVRGCVGVWVCGCVGVYTKSKSSELELTFL
jgi:hypothetical protein